MEEQLEYKFELEEEIAEMNATINALRAEIYELKEMRELLQRLNYLLQDELRSLLF